MGFFSSSSRRKPYKHGKHGYQHYQRKGLLGKLFRTLQSGSHSYNHHQPRRPVQPRPESNTGTCGNCHAKIPAGSKFCLECGEKVETTLYCVNCGEMLPSGAKFCSKCGTKTSG